MASIDTEIDDLRARIAALEEKKKVTTPSIEKLEAVIENKRRRIENNSYSKSLPLARFYDTEKVEFLQPILDALKDINCRLVALESKP
jgi:hypothetical protein